MGVLSLDYRLAGVAPYPAAINDIIEAAGWLHEQGAASVSLFGDSSGGSQVIQTLSHALSCAACTKACTVWCFRR